MPPANGSEIIDPDRYVTSVVTLAKAFIKSNEKSKEVSLEFEDAKVLHENFIESYDNEIDFVIMHYGTFLNAVEKSLRDYKLLAEVSDDTEMSGSSRVQNELFLLKYSASTLSQRTIEYLGNVNRAETFDDLSLNDLLESIDELCENLSKLDRDYPLAMSQKSSTSTQLLIQTLKSPTTTNDMPGLGD